MEGDNEDCQLREKRRRERQAGKYVAALFGSSYDYYRNGARSNVQEGGGSECAFVFVSSGTNGDTEMSVLSPLRSHQMLCMYLSPIHTPTPAN